MGFKPNYAQQGQDMSFESVTVNTGTADGDGLEFAGTSGTGIRSANGSLIQFFIAGTQRGYISAANTYLATAQVTFNSGTISLPALTFADDPNTGMYRPAADEVCLVGGGNQGVRVVADGAVCLAANDSATADGELNASQLSFYLDEAGNTVTVKAKYADGTTIKTGTIAIT